MTYLSQGHKGRWNSAQTFRKEKSVFALLTLKCAPKYVQHLFQAVPVTLLCRQVLVVKFPMVQPLTSSPKKIAGLCGLLGGFICFSFRGPSQPGGGAIPKWVGNKVTDSSGRVLQLSHWS